MTQRPVVLVTGASAGIGLATADRLSRGPFDVVGASRRGTGGPSSTWQALVMDVDDDGSVSRGVEGILASYGRLDAVVASAGWGLAGPVEETPLEDARAQLETNFFGAVRTVQAALAPMRSSGGGRIVLVSSIAGTIALPFQAFYSASKFALEGYGEALSYEVAPFRIDVTLVEPGNVKTDFSAARRTAGSDASGPGAYGEAARKALDSMARDEAHGASAETVAQTIEKVLTAPHPKRRVTAGKAFERAGPLAKRLLPFALFEWAARSSLGL